MAKRKGSTAKKRRLGAQTTITSMRMSPALMSLASKRATAQGISRSQYIEQLVRRDLGVEGVDLEAANASVFG